MSADKNSDSAEGTIAWRFVDSPIYETLLSMQSLLVDWYDDPWAEEAREAMGVAFLRDLRDTFEPFRLGVDLFELAVPEVSDQDVPAFINRLRSMPFAEFSYFVFGRLIPLKGGELSFDPEHVRNLLENYGDYSHYLDMLERSDWSERGPAYQRKFADLIEKFWTGYFRNRASNLRTQHSVSIVRNEAFGRENGTEKLYKMVTGREKMCCSLLPDEPLLLISYVPVVNTTSPVIVYTSQQEVTVIYHASRTTDLLSQLNEKEKRLIALSRALGDGTRFQIVKMLFQNRKALNGQNIAERTHLSKSVVSKHLAQLKDAGVVIESSPDNRNNIYSVDLTILRALSPTLIDVLRG